mmetsp:Transcript_2346/g.3281  ORF Transcript_2346/g.3281 Transcript_2346/m.3281 type:complete len:414 (-) Transcript_2346:256-1497(-)
MNRVKGSNRSGQDALYVVTYLFCIYYIESCYSLSLTSSNRRVSLTGVRFLTPRKLHASDSSLRSFFRDNEERDNEPKINVVESKNESAPTRFVLFGKGQNRGIPPTPDAPDIENEKVRSGPMGDLVEFLQRENESKGQSKPNTYNIIKSDSEDEEFKIDQIGNESTSSRNTITVGALLVLLSSFFALKYDFFGISFPDPNDISQSVHNFFSNPTESLQAVVESVESMGPLGYAYFFTVYTVAEILAIPAIPLTASAGYLFGVRDGTAVVLLSASVAAATSFIIGRTFLRSYVESLLVDYPDFQKIDKIIGEEGFKIILLLRLSPIFPFALSNYLYGVTSVKFWPYFWGTMIGFTPGTLAYVYTGEIGKALTIDSVSAEPWYVYAGGLTLFSAFLKVVADVATNIIMKIEEDSD